MSKYDEQFKRSVVDRYIAGGVGFTELGRQTSVNPTYIKKWVATYRLHGEAGLRKKRSVFSAAFKLSVLGHMRSHGLSYNQVAATFDIRAPDRISIWERQYDAGGIGALTPRLRGRSKKMADTPAPRPITTEDTRTREQLLDELNYLRMENAYLKNLDALIQAKKLAAQQKKRK